MNYYNFIGYFFLLLMTAYDGRSEELDALNEEVLSIRKEAALMRKELALFREEVANRKDKTVPDNTTGITTKQANLAIQ